MPRCTHHVRNYLTTYDHCLQCHRGSRRIMRSFLRSLLLAVPAIALLSSTGCVAGLTDGSRSSSSNLVYLSPVKDDTNNILAIPEPDSQDRSSPESLEKRHLEARGLLSWWRTTAPTVEYIHGVASGDPLQDSVILWTRVTVVPTPSTSEKTSKQVPMGAPVVDVAYQVSTDRYFTKIASQGSVRTSKEVDYIVKVDATGLKPKTVYYYRFVVGKVQFSPIGRTKTLPSPNDNVARFDVAFASCANMPFGFFTAYKNMAEKDIEAVIFLGDYIYEYKDGVYGSGADLNPNRIPEPNHELFTLDDYRTRYAQYRRDTDLQAAHAAHPWFVIWDDHEFADNSYTYGSLNHRDELHGPWEVRKTAAMRAFFEWMPIRQVSIDGEEKIYRSFKLGNIADLILLDTRMDIREKSGLKGTARKAENRTMLGPKQVDWFKKELDTSVARGARWRIIGNQVLFGQGLLLDEDTWGNYPAERKRIMDHMKNNKIDNVVFLTGDIHVSMALDLTYKPFNPFRYNPFNGRGSIAVELVVPSITAKSIEKKFVAGAVNAVFKTLHPHVKYVDTHRKGYCVLNLFKERAVNSWYHMDTVRKLDYTEKVRKQVQIRAGENRLADI